MDNQYPDGKANEQDEGAIAIAIAIGIEDNIIKMDFGKKIAWIGFDKYSAMQVAEALLKHAKLIKVKAH